MICTECNGNRWFYSDNGPAPRKVVCDACEGVGEWEDPIPTLRRYWNDPAFRAEQEETRKREQAKMNASIDEALQRAFEARGMVRS